MLDSTGPGDPADGGPSAYVVAAAEGLIDESLRRLIYPAPVDGRLVGW